MIIRCWGARGSIPVSGSEYLKYGGDSTCIEIRTNDDEVVIIDAGSGIRCLGNRLIEEKRYEYTIIFTHTHWDHIMGFPFFKPIYFKKTRIKIYGCSFMEATLKNLLSQIMSAPYFPVNYEDIRAEITYHNSCSASFNVSSMTVDSIPISHPNQGLGYRFTNGGKSFVFLTDNELGYKHLGGADFKDYSDFSAGADLLVHDAEYNDGEYKKTRKWGHSLYRDALDLGMHAGVKQFALFHHNQERSDSGVDEIVDKCRELIKDKNTSLECFAVSQGMEIKL